MSTTPIRLQKYLSERGIASRRHAAELVKAGKVTVNGKAILVPGFSIKPESDTVALNGITITTVKPESRTILMNKPRGYICSTSSKQGKTIYDLLPENLHSLLPVGRLDKNSEGLLLLSNDGELINQMTHPRYEQEKVYHVSVSGDLNSAALKLLNSRMEIEGYLIRAAEVTILKKQETDNRHMLKFILKEGRKRQIRYMCEHVGLKVHRLQRVTIKDLSIGSLKPGKWRDITNKEANSLMRQI